jgi:hypothetical protein
VRLVALLTYDHELYLKFTLTHVAFCGQEQQQLPWPRGANTKAIVAGFGTNSIFTSTLYQCPGLKWGLPIMNRAMSLRTAQTAVYAG